MRILPAVAAILAIAWPAAANETGCPTSVVVPAATATWYELVGEGACSLPVSPGELTAAIASASYDGSAMCGRCVQVDGLSASVTVRIVDECPTCPGADLDLSPDAFAALDDPIVGVIPIGWATVACDVGGTTMQMQFEGSNDYYLKVQVQNHRYGIAAVELRDASTWLPMARTADDHFTLLSGTAFSFPAFFRITDVHGQSVETGPIAPLGVVNDVPFDAGVQLAACPEASAILQAIAVLIALCVCVGPGGLAARLRLATRETGASGAVVARRSNFDGEPGEGAARLRLATREAGSSAAIGGRRSIFDAVHAVEVRTTASSSAP